ncbi:glucuronate isomerase [Allonocardiopsis opalescens]|uniref:glucuronate isomerase n=1 Tax=Allonocardiopsis opalescens TaxID=1144618 RepID=UPI001B802602|nr:glucuronate isomerase [Allonocardiopsis opalescens]
MPSARDHDRLLPGEPRTRDIARGLYERVRSAPVISPHGHVPAETVAGNLPFGNPADLFISSDHYVIRLLHAAGEPLQDLVDPGGDPRKVWRTFARHQSHFAGTAVAVWFADSLETVFGIHEPLNEENADKLYDAISTALMSPAMRPRALFDAFRITVLATTDDPLDPLEAHAELAADPSFAHRVLPTFRPDRYIDPGANGFRENVERLTAATGGAPGFKGYLDALRARREHFLRHGAVSVDVGVEDPFTAQLDPREAERLFARVMGGGATDADRRLFRGHLLWRMAEMSVEDGLVLTLHPGVRRNHSTRTFRGFGADTGHDIPLRTAFTDELRPLLESFGLEAGFHLVLFTVDETVYSRELAPLAGFYPSVFIGAPWWFLDAPDAILRWRAAITETAGFYRTSGFIDDTRAFLSIPSRHDVSRRVDASFLARYVTEGRLGLQMAETIIDDLVATIPRKAFKL